MRQTKTLHQNFVSPTYIQWSLQVAASPCWKMAFPDVISASHSQDAWVLIPAGHRVHLPVSSPTASAFPKSHPWVGFPHQSAERLHNGRCFEIVTIPYVQASWLVRHPGLPYRYGTRRRAAVTFTSEQNRCRYLHLHRIC